MISTFIKKLLKLYPYSYFLKLNRWRNIIYTHWVKKDFKTFGSNSIIAIEADIKGANCINIGKDVFVHKGSVLTAWTNYQNYSYNPNIVIGNNCSIGTNVNISSINKVEIGDNVLIGRWVTIIDHAHGEFEAKDLQLTPIERPLYSKGGIYIEDNVWIADKVTICSNVRIGKGSIIGANSVVTRDVPPYSMAVGCPAKIIRTFDFI